jgi:hypothetical protein
MDGGTLVVVIITVALIVLPFVLDHRRRSRSGLRTLNTLRETVRQQSCELHAHDLSGELALGLDRHKKVLFLLDEKKEAARLMRVDLDQVQRCTVVKTARRGSANQADGPVEQVELRFASTDRGRSDVHLVLYREVLGTALNGQVQLAEKWAGLVNELLRK